MTSHEELIEEAAKALTALTDAEWEIATAEGAEHLTGYFDAARQGGVLASDSDIRPEQVRAAFDALFAEGFGYVSETAIVAALRAAGGAS